MKRQRSDYAGYTGGAFKRPRGGRYSPVMTFGQSRSMPIRKIAYQRPANPIERKVNDIDSTTYQVNTTGSVTLLCNPQLGSDMNNRVGRKITMKSAYIRGFVATQPGLGLTSSACPAQKARFILFIDTQPNAAAPAVTDILKEAVPSSQLNLNNRDRFRVLKDKMFVFDPYTLSTTATQSYASMTNQIRNFKCYKKINLEVIFNATNGGTIADINSGALYMLWVGSTATGTTDANAVLTTRVRYVDA